MKNFFQELRPLRFRLLAAFLPALILIAAALADTRAQAQSVQQELSGSILRFHVLANSDSPEDQAVKLKVRDAVLEALQPALSEVSTKEEAMQAAAENEELILKTAAEVLTENGVDQPVSMALENCWFPAKTYGELCFPPGYYDALRIQIGNAQGHNWWCVMYPALCFTDMTGGVLGPESEDQLHGVLSDDTYTSMKPVKFRFRFLTFLNRFLEN